MMKSAIGCVVLAASILILSTSSTLASDQPVYDTSTETLTLPSAVVQGQPGRFQDVVLTPDGNGSWRIAELYDGVLLPDGDVNKVSTISTTGLPRQLFIKVAGEFSSGCPEIGRIEQQRLGNVLQVYVYYKGNIWLRNPEEVACTTAIVPFELSIPLDIYGLEAGEYTVELNNHELRKFVLEQDNVEPTFLGGEHMDHCYYQTGQQSNWAFYDCTEYAADSAVTLP